MHKLLGPIWQMVLSGLYNIVPLLGSIVVSAWVISVSSQNVWGTFVAVLLLLDVAFSVINWGAKEYLMREFSKNPAMIARLLSSSLSSRFPLLLLFLCLIPFFHFTNGSIPAIIILCLSRYIQRSFDALLQYNRSFLFSAINETAGIIIIFLILFPVKNSLSPELIVSAFAWSAAAKAISTALYFHNNISPKYLFKFDSPMLFYSLPFLLQSFSGIIQQRADLFAVVYFLEKKDAAQYQVLISFLGFMQLAATLLLFPFIKNIFRFRYSFSINNLLASPKTGEARRAKRRTIHWQ